ncbi:O-acetylhomoserine (thiol)-lyase [Planctomycetaceae bacterium]|nr:MAG: cystathionine gamma-synthase family protein [Burkholderiales bacterium]CAG0927853.1 O-acetylhomoserine (thiol)-lyase [Planctomycetaceae bacterium]
MKARGFTTRILHSDRLAGTEHGAMHKPLHTSVAFGYRQARELARVFQGEASGYVYGRQTNPTVAALEAKITAMEGGIGSVCFGTGMAAIGSTLFSLLRASDHVVSSAFLFGNTNSLFNTFDAQGIAVSFCDATEVASVEAALRPETRLVFVETIANPRTQVADLRRIGELCAARGLIYVVDNTLTTPFLFQARDVKASLVISALTKYIGGHGNALGGVVTDTGLFGWASYPNISESYRKLNPAMWGLTQLRKKGLRDFGASLGPEAAHHLAVGAETLALRMTRACDNAARVAQALACHPAVARVYYPGLADHPQHQRCRELFRAAGALLSFELAEGGDPFAFLDRLEVVVLSSNLGDTRTLAIPVAHTIYYEMGSERRASMGIADSLIRVSVGIEEPEDLLDDFKQALDACG